jgi:hypothetical protein
LEAGVIFFQVRRVQASSNEVASHRQTIIFSSDDSQSLHIIVCYYQWGLNHCWAIWTFTDLKDGTMDLSVIMDLITCI